ncbi:hypothetical protein BH23ACT11_BH23ACT11_25480 [soil metagenome]
MSDTSNDKSTERRRRGPLGDDGEETRQQPSQNEEETRQIPEQKSSGDEDRTRRSNPKSSKDEEKQTQVMRSSERRDSGKESPGATSGGYFEAMEERQERLRDIYGGIDWLASFLGFLLALVAGAFLALIAGLVLVPLGFAVDFSVENLGPAAITALVLVGVLLFLMYFFGGYVAGRLARFDGGLNGAMVILWTVLFAVLLVLAGGIFSAFLPTTVAEQIQSTFQNALQPTFDNLVAQGALGIGILVAIVLVALLASFLGGRVGGRYHRDIDYTL